jgi:nuclear pore complex protein Nup107
METRSKAATKFAGGQRVTPEIDPFARTLDDCLSARLSAAERRSRVLHLPQRFHDIVSRRLAELRSTRKTSAKDDDDVDMFADESDSSALTSNHKEIKRLEVEAQTWDLVRRVIPLRHAAGGDTKPTPHTIASPEPTIKTLIDEFLEENPVAQERLAVVQWLQSNASAGPDIDELVQDLQKNAGRGDIIAHGWLHTRTSIKLRKGVTAWPHLLDRQSSKISTSHTNSNGAPLVTQLDPDATTRQGRKLEPQDEYFERAIWLGCFEHLRRGSSIETIRDWCQERTEMWRAISMSAMLLSRDDKKSHWDTEPSSLALWRRMCFGVARQGGSDDYERAVYGVLSGDISSVEKVAKTWDDHLFANYNALLRTQLDTFVLGRCPPGMTSTLTQSFSSFDAVQYHGQQEGLDKRLVLSLASQKGLELEASRPEKVLQAAVIAKDLDQYLYAQGLTLLGGNSNETLAQESRRDLAIMGEAGSKYFSEQQRHGLRIVAHMYVLTALLERLDVEQGDKQSVLTGGPAWPGSSKSEEEKRRSVQSNIIASYTEYLREENLPELIPLYCSILDPPKSYEVLSRNAIHVTDTGSRIIQLKLIKQAGIDVVTFVKTQANLLYEAAVAQQKKSASGAMFKLIEEGEPSARYGPKIKADFFGEDENAVDEKHRELVRSVEWLLMVNETWPEVFAMGSKIYKFFLRKSLFLSQLALIRPRACVRACER